MWKTVKLGDTINIARGGSPRPIKSFITTEDDGVNWIKIGDTKQGGRYIHTTKEKIKPSGVSYSRYVKENDFLLSNSMSFGRPYILKTSGCIHDGWLVLSEYQKVFSEGYLYYLISSSLVQNQFERLARGSTVRNLNIELVSQVTVPLPPLKEQKRIVAKLDAAFAEIDVAIEAVKSKEIEVENLKASLLNDMTSKNIVKLQSVCEIYNGGTPKSNNKSYWDGDIQWLTPKDMGKLSGRYITNTSRKITIDGLNNSSAKLIPSQSVILSCRAPIGHVFINEVEMSYNQGCKGLIPKSDIKVEYLYYFLFSSKKLLNDLGTGTTFKEISGKVLANVPIPLPSILEQKSIVAKLDTAFSKLEIAKNVIVKSKINYQKLKSSILKQELQSEVA
tara:strand:- start:4528 stop:5697 length:1170 start_codon:yes stop_codon:yes gene_type:complete